MDSSSPFELIFDNFWLILIAVNGINTTALWSKTRSHVQENPRLAPGYDTLIQGFLFWGNLPWVVMGVGLLFGDVPGMRAYFEPQLDNPFVLAWWGTLFLLYILGTYWILWNGGAVMLVKHPGMLRGNPSNPNMIKLTWLLALAGGVMAAVMILSPGLG